MADIEDLPRVVVRGQALITVLRAVLPHLGTGAKPRDTKRLRVWISPGDRMLCLTATDLSSHVLATVELVEAWDGGGEVIDVDMSAVEAGHVVAMHSDVDEYSRLEVLVDEPGGRLQVTDMTGLLPGRSARVSLMEPPVFPGDRRDVTGALARACREPLAMSASMVLDPAKMRAWMRTARALGHLPVRGTVEGNLIVAAGDHVASRGSDWAPAGWSLLGSTWAMGLSTQPSPVGVSAYSGELLAVCEDLEIHEQDDDQPGSETSSDTAAGGFEEEVRDRARDALQGTGLHLASDTDRTHA
ncbi:MAG: hypothetical protein E6640_03270 [Actinomyces urogenitalis]|jgi:hypothetical protein|uniref:hypothetical protein n=1 Tax=Actinomyces urogenitalis TaxID=103621 RepID=UPI002804A3D9|nr:hypothetical protein [Actinomyces urogenitalis]MDU6151227.1 hypothetical protein [Actinomyces urogenitalis]